MESNRPTTLVCLTLHRRVRDANHWGFRALGQSGDFHFQHCLPISRAVSSLYDRLVIEEAN